MSILNNRERELVALGAALASNCIPCIEYHIEEARNAGLPDAAIDEALKFADKIRRVPAEKVMDAAAKHLAIPPDPAKATPSPCCASAKETNRCC